MWVLYRHYAIDCDFPLRGRSKPPPLTFIAGTVKGTSPRFTSSRAIVVFLRLSGSVSMRGFEPCNSCFVRKPATIISRNLESIPGQTPSLATSLKSFLVALCVTAICLVFGSRFSSKKLAHSVRVVTYNTPSNRYSAGTPNAATTVICSQLAAVVRQLGPLPFRASISFHSCGNHQIIL